MMTFEVGIPDFIVPFAPAIFTLAFVLLMICSWGLLNSVMRAVIRSELRLYMRSIHPRPYTPTYESIHEELGRE